MRHIEFNNIVETVKSLCIDAAYELPADVLAAFERAAENESNPRAVRVLNQLIENARTASSEKIPLCQDTGLAVVFVEQAADTIITPPTDDPDATIYDAINAGVAAGYEQGFLRKSVVAEPLNHRKNTTTNTPAIIHHTVVGGDKLKITVMCKGGGCENKSQFKMFKPTASKEQIIDWIVDVAKQAGADACPPFIVGVGIGGNFELSCLLSKRALLRNLDSRNSDSYYADMESRLLAQINTLNIGPAGLGGDTTALAVLVETAACHIASLPVAVNIDCHSHRHSSAVI